MEYMRVKLTKNQALKARDSRAQGGRVRESGLWNPGKQGRMKFKPCKGETVSACFALTGLDLLRSNPGLRLLRSLALGFAVSRFQRLVLSRSFTNKLVQPFWEPHVIFSKSMQH
jgi:hypothetical protein